MTNERLTMLNDLKQQIDGLEYIITELEYAENPAIMNCDWDTHNHDLILDLRGCVPLLDSVKQYLKSQLEMKRKIFEEG